MDNEGLSLKKYFKNEGNKKDRAQCLQENIERGQGWRVKGF